MTDPTAPTLPEESRGTSAFDDVLVGGNHLANSLIAYLGGHFARDFPPDLDPEIVLGKLSDLNARRKLRTVDQGNVAYDIWCAWSAIMMFRDSPTAAERPFSQVRGLMDDVNAARASFENARAENAKLRDLLNKSGVWILADGNHPISKSELLGMIDRALGDA